MNSRFPSSDCAIFFPFFPARSSSTGFSLCGLNCGPLTEHWLKPVLPKATSCALPHGSLFDRLLIIRSLKNGVHENSRCVHAIGRQGPQFDPLSPFRDTIARRLRIHGMKILGGLA